MRLQRQRATFRSVTTKRLGSTATISSALKNPGVEDTTASLAAELGILALKRAQAHWSEPTNTKAFCELARQSLDELRAASIELN